MGLGWDGIGSPGGRGYRAPYGANNTKSPTSNKDDHCTLSVVIGTCLCRCWEHPAPPPYSLCKTILLPWNSFEIVGHATWCQKTEKTLIQKTQSLIWVRATSLSVFGFSRRLSLSQCPCRKFLEKVLIQFKRFVNVIHIRVSQNVHNGVLLYKAISILQPMGRQC